MFADALEPHVRWLMTTLGLPRTNRRGRLHAAGATARVFVFRDSQTGHQVSILPPPRAILDAAGIALAIDEYTRSPSPSATRTASTRR